MEHFANIGRPRNSLDTWWETLAGEMFVPFGCTSLLNCGIPTYNTMLSASRHVISKLPASARAFSAESAGTAAKALSLEVKNGVAVIKIDVPNEKVSLFVLFFESLHFLGPKFQLA